MEGYASPPLVRGESSLKGDEKIETESTMAQQGLVPLCDTQLDPDRDLPVRISIDIPQFDYDFDGPLAPRGQDRDAPRIWAVWWGVAVTIAYLLLEWLS